MADSHHHDDHDDGAAHAHDFDGEPTRELSPGEPRTPSWVPMLGLGLFLVAGIYGLTATSGGEDEASAAASAGASASAAPAAPAPPAPRGEVVRIDPPGARPAGTAPDPERVREIQERIMKMREEGKLPVAPQPQPQPQ